MAEEIEVKFTAKDQTAGALSSMKRGLEAGKIAATSLQGVLGALGITASAAGAFLAFKSAIDGADNMGKMAQKAGVAVEDFSALAYAASLSDVSNEELIASFRYLGRAMEEAEKPGSETAKLFKQLGITAKDPIEAFKQAADGIGKMPEGFAKLNAAQALFGRGAQQLLPLLNGTKEGLEAATEEAKRMGFVIDKETAQAAEKFNDDLTRLETAGKVVFLQIAKDAVPSLSRISAEFFNATKENNLLIGSLYALRQLLKETFIGGQDPISLLKKESEEAQKQITVMEKEFERLQKNPNAKIALGVSNKAALDDIKKALDERKSLIAKNEAEIGNIIKAEEDKKKQSGANPPTTGNINTQAVNALKNKSKALNDAQKAYAEAELSVLRESQKAALDIYQDSYKAGQISLADYTNARLALIEEMGNREIALLERERTAIANQKPADAADRDKQNAALIKLDADIARRKIALSGETSKISNEYRTEVAENLQTTSQFLDQLNSEAAQKNRSFADGAKDAFVEYAQAAGDNFSLAKQAASNVFNGMTEALTQFVTTGKLDFSAFANSIIADLARIAIQKQVAGLLGNLFGGGGDFATNALAYAGINHTGGVVGGNTQTTRRVPSAVFAGAPRLHSGGYIRPDEVPTILQKGEEVLAKNDPRNIANGGAVAPNVNIQVINQGTPQNARAGDIKFDGRDLVVSIILNDISTNGPITQSLKRNI